MTTRSPALGEIGEQVPLSSSNTCVPVGHFQHRVGAAAAGAVAAHAVHAGLGLEMLLVAVSRSAC